VTIQNTNHRAPLAAQTEAEPRSPSVFENRLEIRSPHGHVGTRLTAWIHDRLGRQLGKFAPSIERIEVRFEDLNGTKGGLDRSCMVHLVLSALPPVVVEMQAPTDHEAFDLAASRAERATRRNLEKHGFSTGHKKRHRGADKSDIGNGVLAAADGLALDDVDVSGAADGGDGLVDGGGGNPLAGSSSGVPTEFFTVPVVWFRTMKLLTVL